MSSALQELSTKVSTQVATITKLLEASGTPSPSLTEAGALDVKAIREEDPSLIIARNELLNAAQDLVRLAQGPIDHVITLSYASIDTANLETVLKFEIPQKVPYGSTISLADLTTQTGLPEDVLARTVRYAITNGIFAEPTPGQFAHTAASATLAKNKGLHDMAMFNGGFSTRVTVNLADTLKLQQEKGPDGPVCSFNVAYPNEATLFGYLGKNPDESRVFFDMLDGRSQLPRYAIGNVSKSWDWAAVGSGTIVDLGGSSGFSSIDLARHFPHAKFVVEDRNTEGLNMGREIVAKEQGLQQRITFLEHDFFTPQPIQADVYFLRHILIDWTDVEGIKIIQALIPALKDGARVLLSEAVIPEPPSKSSALLEDKQVLIDDLIFLGVYGTRQRKVEEYTKLFKQASSSFSFVGVRQMPGIYHSLLEYKYTKS